MPDGFQTESDFNHAAAKVAGWDQLSAARDAFNSVCNGLIASGVFTEHDLKDVKGQLEDSMSAVWAEVSSLKDDLDAYEGYDFRDGPQKWGR